MISFSKRVKKGILDLCAILTFLSWLAFLYMRYDFYAGMSSSKYDAATGYIFEINNHGCIFYLNSKQNMWTYFPLIFVVAFLFTLFLMETRWKIYKEINDGRPKPLKQF